MTARGKGVIDVVNYLQIQSPGKLDEEIWEEIRRAFWWDPGLYDQDIAVAVSNGTVILKGTAPSIVEWKRAREVARNSGAERVRNRLRVRYGPDFHST